METSALAGSFSSDAQIVIITGFFERLVGKCFAIISIWKTTDDPIGVNGRLRQMIVSCIFSLVAVV